MKCIKCFSEMTGPDYIVDVDEKYTSINAEKYLDYSMNYSKLVFIRGRPKIELQTKLSMCCVECGYITKAGINIKLKSKLPIQKYIKDISK